MLSHKKPTFTYMLHSHTINSEWKKFKNGTKIKQLRLKVSEHIWCGIPVLMKMCLIKMRFKFKWQWMEKVNHLFEYGKCNLMQKSVKVDESLKLENEMTGVCRCPSWIIIEQTALTLNVWYVNKKHG